MADLLPVPDSVINALRRKVGEYSDTPPWDNETLIEILQNYALTDADGNDPGDDAWVPTYDINAAAAQIWDEKAASLATNVDASVDGTSVRRSQLFQHAKQMAAYYRSLRVAKVVNVTTFEDVADVDLDDLGVTDGTAE